MILLSFVFCLLFFIVVGLLSATRSSATRQDYLLATHSVKPWLVALSAVATNNSGYMFIGMIGFTWLEGLSSLWLMIGWILGDFCMSLIVHRRLRDRAGKSGALSFAGALSQWQGHEMRWLRALLGIVTIAFLGSYAAAQFTAGSKALHVLFGWDYAVGAVVGCIIVMMYCFAGGIRASIWTDAAQSLVMFSAMAMLCFVGLDAVGGASAFLEKIATQPGTYANLMPPAPADGSFFSPGLFIAGWFFAGIGVIGQPHIMVRFMAMDHASSMPRARIYYYAWFTGFYGMTVMVGLLSRLLIPDADVFDAELALPLLAQMLMPEILVGVVLAGIFAATMSTADSQILACTAAVSRDLAPQRLQSFWRMKTATIVISLLALAIALSGTRSVFSLVLLSWSGLASAFGPLLVLLALGRAVPEWLGVLIVLAGLGTATAWYLAGLGGVTYEVLPGFLAGILTYVVGVGTMSLARRMATTPHSSGR